MAYEPRWYDCGTGYRVLVMDPNTSGATWAEVETLIVAGGELPATVYRRRWGYEDNHDPANIDPVAQDAYVGMCKVETIRLAELTFTPPTPPLLRS